MRHYFFLFIAILLFACQDSETNSGHDNNSNSQNNTAISSENELIINGNDIWIRSMPYNGEVAFKLKIGDRCKIIEEGPKDQVNNIFDFWYRIEFNGKSGWVFGSQTNKTLSETIVVNDFDTFLKEFAKDYAKKSKIPEKYIKKNVGNTFLFNPGAYCVAYTDETNSHINRNVIVPNVFQGIPKGDFCEGYPDAKDGFYYEACTFDKLPKFAVFSDKSDEDIITGSIELPDYLTNNDFKTVQIVVDGYHFAYLYFINIDEDWFLICEDYCDCSA